MAEVSYVTESRKGTRHGSDYITGHMPPHAPATNALDPGRLIDEGAWTTYQKLLIFGTAMTIENGVGVIRVATPQTASRSTP